MPFLLSDPCKGNTGKPAERDNYTTVKPLAARHASTS